MLQSIQSTQDMRTVHGTGIGHGTLFGDIAKTISKGCAAFPPLGSDAKVRNVVCLVAAGAWTEAALAMVDIEAPEWTMRRLEIDDGEWFCSLSRHPAVPAEFDDMAEGRHRLLPVAILAALAEAKQQSATGRVRTPAVPDRTAAPSTAAWCDNCR
jgi:hypothetical protein